MKNRLRIISAAAIAVALAGGTAHAADVVWDGLGGDGVWTNTGNWTGGVLPAAGDGNWATIANGDTVTYADGYTNSVQHHSINGGSTLNFTGGSLSDNKSGNTRRTYLGTDGEGTLNMSGGKYNIGHILRVGIGGTGTVNLNGGLLDISRGGNATFGNTSTSLSIGNDAGQGTVNIISGTLQTRVAVEVGPTATFDVYGAASTISIGGHGGAGDGQWFQSSNGVLRVGISTNGVTPIVLNDTTADGTPQAKLGAGSILDVSFVDGAMETASWPVIICTNGTINNLGMVFADSIDTNDWGFITSNDTLYVGYGLGWPAGGDVVSLPDSQRTLYWNGAGGDSDSSNPTNWLVDGTTETDWGPYSDDIWKIGDIAGNGVELGINYVVDYDDTAINNAHRDLEVGVGAQGTFNYNSGDLTFTSHTSGRQEIGLNANGDGTLNMNGGTLTLNACRVGVSGGNGTVNVAAGTWTVSRAYGDYSLWVGHGGSSTGIVTVVGGRMFTRTAVKLGDGVAVGVFNVDGSVATEIGIGSNNSLDGAWYQNSGSILKANIDEGGITPITVVNKDAAVGGHDGNVYFYDGSILDIGWMAGVTNYGSFDVMTWEGSLVESNLTLAAGVDTSIWSFEFLDTNGDTTNDTLRAIADAGTTDNGTSISWLLDHGLTEADDEVDNDNDGLLSWEEYVAGTDPTNMTSVLKLTGVEESGDDIVITWQSVEGKNYSVLSNTDLVFGTPEVEASDIIGLPNETTYTGTVGGASAVFYEIEVQ